MSRLALSPLAAAALIFLAVLNLGALIGVSTIASRDSEVNVATVGWTMAGGLSHEKGIPPAKPATAYQDTLSRPLFFKTRRPYMPPPPPPPPAPPPVVVVAAPLPPPAPPPPPLIPEPELSFAGVSIVGGVKKAYLAPRANPDEGIWVIEGEEIQGWQVNAITDSTVALQSAGRTLQLMLYGDSDR